jgi:hypothetical protein
MLMKMIQVMRLKYLKTRKIPLRRTVFEQSGEFGADGLQMEWTQNSRA